MSAFKTLVTCSGTGGRLNGLVTHTNKALINVDGRPAISHIIEYYPEDTEFVCTLGYKGDLVKQYLNLVYPARPISFVTVDPYEGPGSSLLYSMYQAKDLLQCPFIFHCCDTLVDKTYYKPSIKENWVGACPVTNGQEAQYRYAVRNAKDEFDFISHKGVPFRVAHIGLVGVKDYEDFWLNAKDILYACPPDEAYLLSDVDVINASKVRWNVHDIKGWLDTGTPEALEFTRCALGNCSVVLPKVDTETYVLEDSVVKFFADTNIARKKVDRAEILKGIVPDIFGQTENFFSYQKAEGSLMTDTYPSEMMPFLKWCQSKLWTPQDVDISGMCKDFYQSKTLLRLDKFYEITGIKDENVEVINGAPVLSLKTMFDAIPWDHLYQGIATKQFHGDLHFSNAIRTADGYKLIDWREDFAGNTMYGDVYYDLAKINHGLIVAHDLVAQNQFQIDTANGVTFDILRRHRTVQCQEELFTFLAINGYSVHKVHLLTALIFLNICPLHHHPYNLFLYYLGKKMLWEVLQCRL
jgi:choline kinase